MSNGNVFERLWKLLATSNKLVLDGRRDAEALCSLLQDFIEQKSYKTWKTWKTIKLGTGLQTSGDFRWTAERAGMRISERIVGILSSPAFTVAPCEMEVELVIASVAELGLKHDSTLKEIYVLANELGLDLCPPEVGPQLRLQYTDQPKGEKLVIAMEPLTDSEGCPDLFGVVRNCDTRWLDARRGDTGYVWGGGTLFVFLRRK